MEKKFIHQRNKMEIYFDIILEEPLHIGVSSEIESRCSNTENLEKKDKEEGTALIKILTMKDTNEPYIPGSSLRGVFRSKYFEILEELGEDIKNNDLFGYVDNKNKVAKRGRIIIEDSYMEGYKKYKEIYAFTPIKGQTSLPLAIQMVEKGSIFKAKLTLKNIDYVELYRILQVFILSFYDEVRIGSNKSRGFGRVKLKIENIILEKNDSELLSDEIEKYFQINNKRSIKVANDKYLLKVFELKDKKYKNFDFSNLVEIKLNDFLMHIEERGKR